MKTDLFHSYSHCWVFQICWHIECNTFTASSFRTNPQWLHKCMLSCFRHGQLCDPIDCSPPGFSVRGILQARILEWVAKSSSRGSFWLRDQTLSTVAPTLLVDSLPPGKPVLSDWKEPTVRIRPQVGSAHFPNTAHWFNRPVLINPLSFKWGHFFKKFLKMETLNSRFCPSELLYVRRRQKWSGVWSLGSSSWGLKPCSTTS